MRNAFRSLVIFLTVVTAVLPARAAFNREDLGFFPPAHELFKPLQADPRELQYALRWVFPVTHKSTGEVALGDYLGLYRWALPMDDSYFQVSGGGGVFGRFDLSEESNSLLVADFYATLPFDFRWGKFAARFMPFHTSSHLGDDYLSRTGLTTSKHTWDNLRWLASCDAASWGRVYGGYTYTFRELPSHFGRNAFQTGFELQTPWMGKGRHMQGYWANDAQFWQRSAWNPMVFSQLGVHLSKKPGDPRGVSVFTEFGTGPNPYGQFFLNHETRWDLGIKFHLG